MTQTFYMVQKNPLRTVVQPDGSIWFVAKDACALLDIKNYRDAVSSLDDDERGCRKFRHPLRNQHGEYGEQEQELLIIAEPGLYRLAFRSNKAEAKAFTRWVTHEVLPSIRRTGSYTANLNPQPAALEFIERNFTRWCAMQ